MLGVLCPHRDSPRVAVLDLDIDVGQRRVKRAGVGVGHRPAGRVRIARTPAAEPGAAAREEDQLFFVRRVLIPRRVRGQQQQRPRRAVANHADAGPNVHRLAQAIAPFRKQHDPLSRGLLDPVDRLLQRRRVVRARPGDAHRLRVLKSLGVIRRRPHRQRRQQEDQCQDRGTGHAVKPMGTGMESLRRKFVLVFVFWHAEERTQAVGTVNAAVTRKPLSCFFARVCHAGGIFNRGDGGGHEPGGRQGLERAGKRNFV